MRISFRQKILLAAEMAGLALLAACAPRPVASTWPITTQAKMQAAQHWDMLAADVVDELSEKLPPASAGLVEVRGPAIATDFSDGFRTFLTTRLTDAGYRVALNGGQTAIEFRTQVIAHASGERDRRPPPGTFTVMAAGIGIGELISHHWGDAALAGSLGGLGLLFDAASGAYTTRTDTEIIESVSIVDHGIINYQKAFVFYINDDQRAEYEFVPPNPGPTTVQIAPNPQLAQVWSDADRQCDGKSGAVLRRVEANEGGASERRFGCWERY